jgi:hypothetical protein
VIWLKTATPDLKCVTELGEGIGQMTTTLEDRVRQLETDLWLTISVAKELQAPPKKTFFECLAETSRPVIVALLPIWLTYRLVDSVKQAIEELQLQTKNATGMKELLSGFNTEKFSTEEVYANARALGDPVSTSLPSGSLEADRPVSQPHLDSQKDTKLLHDAFLVVASPASDPDLPERTWILSLQPLHPLASVAVELFWHPKLLLRTEATKFSQFAQDAIRESKGRGFEAVLEVTYRRKSSEDLSPRILQGPCY